MCGLVSMISKRSWGFINKDIEVFEELLTIDQLRGQDATGAFCVHRNRQVSGIKLAATPWHLFKQPEYNTFRNKASQHGRIHVGHNRKATQGAATDPKNAHPFQEDNIILVHNGSLYNRQGLPERDVDSHAVAAAFASGDYSEVLRDINGAYAFIWWDMKRNILSVARNSQRPLWKLENKENIILCSEAWMGYGAARRNGVGVNKGEEFELTEVKADTIYHYEIGGKLVEEEGVKKAPVVTHRPTVTTTNTSASTQGKANTVTGPTTGNIPTNVGTSEASALSATRFPFQNDPGFKKGQRILVQITRVRTLGVGESATFNAMGITVNPGHHIVDCVGLLPSHVTHDVIDRWQQFPVTAEVVDIQSTLRGISVSLKHFSMAPLVMTHPNGIITQQDWDFVVENCACKHCNGAIGEYEPHFTSVKTQVSNEKRVYEVTCADCIEERIQDKEVKEEFTNGRIDALQKWEQVGLRSGNGTDQATRVQGNSTTH